MEARVAIGVALLVACSLGSILYVTVRVVTSRSLARAAQDLGIARNEFALSLQNQADSVAALTRLVADLPVFRAHLTDGRLEHDRATMEVMADSYRRQLKAKFCIVTDASGGWLASPGWPVAGSQKALRANVGGALHRESRHDIVAIAEQLFLVVSEPASFGDEVLGTFTAGYVLDDAFATGLARTTHCEVSLVSGSRLCASSLRNGERSRLAALVAGGADPLPQASASRVLTLGRERYVGGAFPLLDQPVAAGRVRLMLFQDWRPTQQFIDQLRIQFIGAAIIIFGCALAAGLLFSRRMSQPLKEIVTAAREIAAGNLAREVSVQGTSEARTVAVAFNEMSSSLRMARERLVHDAIHDHLTTLPNRILFMERLQRAFGRRARHSDYAFAVLFVDLDRFKTINDSLGHPFGDRVLIEISSRLASALREADVVWRASTDDAADTTLARHGGDEFIVLLEEVADPSDPVRIAERIQDEVSKPLTVEGREIFITASIGIAISTPAHRDGEDVVRDADLAMYRAKAAGGDRCELCDTTLHQRAVERLQLESDLRRAVERREFVLHYQPIVSFATRRTNGFEALIRWRHPERGMLLPAAFLAVAEETGIITKIDEWVLAEACAEARTWKRYFPADPPVTVSVNLSAKTFGRPDLVGRVARILQETGLEAQRLRLEITESVAMADAERARAVLIGLKSLGVRISLDDFGTGYSSLSYLQRFPVDVLKIDRAFVTGLDRNDESREIIRTILGLAQTLGLDVVAEGAETAEQVAYLTRLGCTFGQGYYFSVSLPPDQLDSAFAPEISSSFVSRVISSPTSVSSAEPDR